MSTETTNIHLVLPELSEQFDLDGHWNHNSEIIDSEIGAAKLTIAGHSQSIEGLQQTTAAQALLIQGKQDALTFDSTPTAGSDNPVTSAGIKTALDDKATKETFSLTLAGSPLSVSEYAYSCIVTGDIVTVCIRLTLAAELAVNTSRNLFKIPADYRPPVTCAGTGYANSKVCTFWANTSGDIKIRIDEAIPAGASINANFCYSYKSDNWITVTPPALNAGLQTQGIRPDITLDEPEEEPEER